MSQVPNRYFNSPWIADAAKNLSLAIAGDPERDAARLDQKRTELLMQREQEKATLEAQDRAKKEQALPLWSELLALAPDDLEGRRRVAGQLAPLIGGFTDTLGNAMGLAGPEATVVMEKLNKGVEGRMSALEANQAAITARANADRELRGQLGGWQHEDRQEANRLKEAALNLRGAIDWAKLDLKDKNGKSVKLPATAQMALTTEAMILAQRMKGSFSGQDMIDLTRKAANHWTTSGDPVTSMYEAFREQYGANPQKKPGSKGFFGYGEEGPGEFIRIDGQPAPAGATPLADVVAPGAPGQPPAAGAAPVPAAAAATPAAAPNDGGGLWNAIASVIGSAPASNPQSAGRLAPSPAAGAPQLSSAVVPSTSPQMVGAGRAGRTVVPPAPPSRGRGAFAPPSAPAPTAVTRAAPVSLPGAVGYSRSGAPIDARGMPITTEAATGAAPTTQESMPSPGQAQDQNQVVRFNSSQEARAAYAAGTLKKGMKFLLPDTDPNNPKVVTK